MSTKNLARTVIEGGRCKHYKSDVLKTARAERAQEKTYLRAVSKDPELADAVVAPKRQPISLCFADKLGPVYSFLETRLGRSWDKTFRLLKQRFDTRTTPGRHVVESHILAEIAPSEAAVQRRSWTSFRYFIDARGLLRQVKREYRKYVKLPPQPSLEDALKWLGNRKVELSGARYVWFVPTRDLDTVRAVWVQSSIIYADATQGVPWVQTSVPFRQSGELTVDEISFVESLPEKLREKVLEAPVPNSKRKIFWVSAGNGRRSYVQL